MHYQHRYHAGNFADVFKHVLLIGLLDALNAKPAPWAYLDTHAGSGRYRWDDAALAKTGWTLTHVLLTHHHYDHIDGLPEVLAAHPAQVIGAKADAARLRVLDLSSSLLSPWSRFGDPWPTGATASRRNRSRRSGPTIPTSAFPIPG